MMFLYLDFIDSINSNKYRPHGSYCTRCVLVIIICYSDISGGCSDEMYLYKAKVGHALEHSCPLCDGNRIVSIRDESDGLLIHGRDTREVAKYKGYKRER